MPRNILVIEDQPSQLRLLEPHLDYQLSYYHINTACVINEQNKTLLDSKEPEVVLLDLAITGSDYIKIIRDIKTVKPHCPIITLVAYGNDPLAIQAIMAGANDYITKPVRIERLKLTIQNVLKIQNMLQFIQQLEVAQYSHQNKIVIGTAPTLVDVSGHIKKLKSIEEEAIRFALIRSGGSMTRAARDLGIGRSTLYRKIDSMSQFA